MEKQLLEARVITREITTFALICRTSLSRESVKEEVPACQHPLNTIRYNPPSFSTNFRAYCCAAAPEIGG